MILVIGGLVAQFFCDEEDFDSACMTTSSCNHDIVAEAIAGKTVSAFSDMIARSISVKSLCIGRASTSTNTLNTGFHVADDLIHTN